MTCKEQPCSQEGTTSCSIVQNKQRTVRMLCIPSQIEGGPDSIQTDSAGALLLPHSRNSGLAETVLENLVLLRKQRQTGKKLLLSRT
ncbi:MAG: hypothetical protein N2487_00860 [Verrucomicrobiae bacterium]|nr:hypothetical protein [Verrucomicrobiae bacterium]